MQRMGRSGSFGRKHLGAQQRPNAADHRVAKARNEHVAGLLEQHFREDERGYHQMVVLHLQCNGGLFEWWEDFEDRSDWGAAEICHAVEFGGVRETFGFVVRVPLSCVAFEAK